MNLMKILFENCDPDKANDRELPNNSFLVEYKVDSDAASSYDIAAAAKQSEIFDHYYDCLLYTSPSPRDMRRSRMPSSA